MASALGLATVPPLLPPARAVSLVGFMGAGKTAVGEQLAARLGLAFCDTDLLIEQRAGQSVPEIFAQHGEEHFRALETEALRQALGGRPAVVATGGGIMTRAHNVALLRAVGPIIWLWASVSRLLERSLREANRPLLAVPDPAARAKELLAARRAFYELADYTVNADTSPVPAVVESVLAILRSDARAAPLCKECFLRVPVHAPPASYEVIIGHGVLNYAADLLASRAGAGTRAVVLTAEGPCQAYAEQLACSLQEADLQASIIAVPDSEESKSLDQLTALYRRFVELGLDRSAWVFAVGGGMVGDLAGVAAATYLRGLNLVQVPTSLLSQIDSSLGGKTAVNLPAGKNLVGAFYHPRLVLADLQALQTLPPAQLLDGLAEGIKHAALFDAAFFEWLEEHWGEVLARDAVALRYFVGRNVQLKARLVSVDPAERYLRALLNFGHTVGHALERAAAAWALSHGQAVALGMVAEAELGQELGYTPAEVVERLEAMLARVGLPTGKVAVDGERVWAALQADKKRGVGGFKLPVLCGLGRATVMTLRTPERLEAALRRRLQGE